MENDNITIEDQSHGLNNENLFPYNLKLERLETENANTPKQLPQNLNTPIFNLPNTEKEKHGRRSSHLIDAFTLQNSVQNQKHITIGSTFQKKENSSSFGDNMLTITKENQEKKPEENFEVMHKELENLKNYLKEFELIVEEEKKGKLKFSDISQILEENYQEQDPGTTLPLNDITSVNQSFMYDNTPSRWKSQHQRESFCLLGSNITANSVDLQQVSRIRVKSEINESIFMKSHEFPRYLKRRTKKSYTKMLVPGECLINSSNQEVIIKVSKYGSKILKEIMMQLYLYEKNLNYDLCSISKMNDYFNVQNKFHLIYEYKGEILKEIKSSIVNRENLLSSIKELANSVRALHDIGLLHLQINSESVCYEYNKDKGKLKFSLCDFERLSFRNGNFLGLESDGFSCPEMLVNMDLDEKCDVWSLGCLTYFLLTGKELIQAQKKEEIVFLIRSIFETSGEISIYMANISSSLTSMLELEKIVKDRKEDLERLKSGDHQLWQFLIGMLKVDPKNRFSATNVIEYEFDE